MSAADEPRMTGFFGDAVILARTVIEDSGLLSQADGDKLAEAVTERLLGEFLTRAEAGSRNVFGMEGTGPFCSWCGRMPGPVFPKHHPQYGLFCDCKRDEPAAGAVAA